MLIYCELKILFSEIKGVLIYSHSIVAGGFEEMS